MAEKLFYSMGEVAEMFDVKPSLLRHWESQFSVIRPRRNKKGNRIFTPQDVENLKLIYHLVKERGMTLEGAKKALRQPRAGREVPRDAELMERLQRIRSLLVEVREDLKADEGEVVAVGDSSAEAADADAIAGGAGFDAACADGTDGVDGAAGPRSRRRKAVVKIAPEGAAEEEKKPAVRRPRRKKDEGEVKELFAFYEQSLF